MSKRKSEHPGKGATKHSCTVQTTVFKYFQPTEKPSSSSSPTLPKPMVTESPQSFGIKYYSPQELESVSGLQKDYRQFWNEKAEELCSDKSVRAKLGNKAAISGAIDCSWTLHKTQILQLQAEKMLQQTKQFYTDEVSHSHELSAVTNNVERMLQACTSVNLIYIEIESAASVAEKSSLEKVLENEMSELKKAQAALQKAMKEKNKIMEAEEEDEIMIAGSPIQLSDRELESLVETIVKEDSEYVSDSEEDSPDSPEIPLMLPGLK